MARARRPVPDDFAVMAHKMTIRELGYHYHANWSLTNRWLAESGIERIDLRTLKPSKPKPPKAPKIDWEARNRLPSNFAALAVTKHNRELMTIFGRGRDQIAKWRAECGVPLPKQGATNLRPIPDGFDELARKMPVSQLARHFNACDKTINRWGIQRGITLLRAERGRPSFNNVRPRLYTIDSRDGSFATRAQSWLQRYVPVWRCSETGQFNPKGTHFRVDGVIRTEAEMIERAKRKGFDASEWERIAA